MCSMKEYIYNNLIISKTGNVSLNSTSNDRMFCLSYYFLPVPFAEHFSPFKEKHYTQEYIYFLAEKDF